jgi:GNAT superfamily N-acetyltransferase
LSNTDAQNWTVSPSRASDLGPIADLVNAAYRGEGGYAGWTSEIDLVQGRRTTLSILQHDLAACPGATILVLREADRLLACVRLERTEGTQGESACYIGMLAVQPGMQDRGVGRVLLQHAESQGRTWGARVARMTVVSIRASLIAWYARRGYRLTGETERFPYDDLRFGAPLRPDLEFAVLEKVLLDAEIPG